MRQLLYLCFEWKISQVTLASFSNHEGQFQNRKWWHRAVVLNLFGHEAPLPNFCQMSGAQFKKLIGFMYCSA